MNEIDNHQHHHDPNKHIEEAIHGPPPVASGSEPIYGGTGRLSRIGIFRPLRIKDFALLWIGMTISLLGDGIYYVAIAFQVYELSNSPTALSVVFFAWTAPMVVFFLLAGVLSDRFDRRMLMVAADVLRGLAMAAVGLLSISGELTIGRMLALVAVYGIGDSLFMPAFTAIVPDIVPRHLLLEANSLDSFVRPLMMRMLGPAIGGVLIATTGPGEAILINAGTFALSVIFILMIKSRPVVKTEKKASAIAEIKEGVRFVRSEVWIWATLASAAIGLLTFIGPLEVLVPYVVKNDMGGDAGDYGLILSLGGVGAVLVSVAMGQLGLPKRHMTYMYTVWGIGVLLIAGFAFTNSVWQAMAVSFLMSAMFTAGMIVWTTLMHKLVPSELMGRVASLDWLVSTALVPLSFILTGPIADAIGVKPTLIGAGVIGSALTFVFLLVPGIHDTERDGRVHDTKPPSSPEVEAKEEVPV